MTLQIKSIHPLHRPPFKLTIPFSISYISAGFPSPAEEYMEKIDIESWLFERPHSTFLVRVHGQSMIEHGIFSDDILVVDRSIQPHDGSVIIAILYDEFLVKQLILNGSETCLRSGHPDYPDIIIHDPEHFEVWGVVRYSIHSV